MARFDFKLVDNDPITANGDFVIGESDEQHIQDTINAFPGWWKQFPDDGVGIQAYQNSPADTQVISKSIRLQLTSDGYKVSNPVVTLDTSGNMIIQPNATI